MNENKTNINWYPGHMAKTKRQIMQDLKLIDIVIEILDARIPMSSRNPDINEITKNKKKIIVLNKSDLADDNKNKEWVKKLSNEAPTILTDANTGKGINNIFKVIDELMKEEKQRQASRGFINKTTRLMILGIPNVGKSSFINRITKTNKLEVGNRPGVTKNKQWIRIGKNQELMDTPGVLWPKFENEQVALNLSYIGTIKDEILDKVEIAYQLLKLLKTKYIESLKQRYKISEEELENIDKLENPIYELMKLIGKKRGALIAGGNVDDEKTANIILDDFRTGRIGKITLEEP
ncbi:MAG: ribosome biogenesis GTPase YlqF [Anaeroplasma sp.]